MDAASFYDSYNTSVRGVPSTDVQKMETFGEFSFPDFDIAEGDFGEDLLECTTNFTEEYVRNTTVAENYSIKSISVVPLCKSNVFDMKLSAMGIDPNDLSWLERSFIDFFTKNDFEIITSDNIFVDTFNMAFPSIRVESKERALQQYLWVHFGFKVDGDTFLEYCTDLDEEFLHAVNVPYRELTAGEISTVKRLSKEEYFEFNLLKLFSLEPRDTSLLLRLLENNNRVLEELVRYCTNKDALNAYLILKNENLYDSQSFEKAMLSGTSIDTYVELCLSGSSGVEILALSGRADFDKIVSIVRGNNKDARRILSKYGSCEFLTSVLNAFYADRHCAEFVDNYLCVPNELAARMAADYESNAVPGKYLVYFKGNYYLSKFFGDMDALELKLEQVQENLKVGTNLNELFAFARAIIKANLMGTLSNRDYKRFLCVSCLQKSADFFSDYMRLSGETVLGFNKYWFSKLLTKLYGKTPELQNDIGSVLAIGIADKQEFSSVLELIARLDSFVEELDTKFLGKEIAFTILPGDCGIGLYDRASSNYRFEQELVSSAFRSTTSLDSYIDSPRSTACKERSQVTQLFKCNFINVASKVGSVSDNAKQFESCSVKSYLKYDRILSSLQSQNVDYLGALQSANFKTLLDILLLVNHISNRGLHDYYFLDVLFRGSYKDRYNRGPANLQNFEVIKSIDIIGIAGYLGISFKDFISNLDTILSRLNMLDNIRMLADSTTGKITIKGSCYDEIVG